MIASELLFLSMEIDTAIDDVCSEYANHQNKAAVFSALNWVRAKIEIIFSELEGGDENNP